MSLAESRRKGAEAAILAFLKAKEPRRPSAVALSPETNPDLQDDLVDLVADVLIWAKAEGLDPAYIARVGASHAEPAAVAEDMLADAAAEGRLKADEGPVWIIERSGEPWVGDWMAKADALSEYPTRGAAEDKNASLGAGGRYYIYEAYRETNDAGVVGYRLTDKLTGL